MHINLRIGIDSNKRQLLAVTEFWNLVGKGQIVLDLKWPSEQTKAITKILSKDAIDLWHAYILFDKKELANYDYFELIPMQVVNPSATDSKLFDKDIQENAIITCSRKHMIPSRVIASSIKLNENCVASYGYSQELITSILVIELLNKSAITGWYTQDVSKRNGDFHTLYKRLNARNLIEVICFDMSTPRAMSGLAQTTIDNIMTVLSSTFPNQDAESAFLRKLQVNSGERKKLDTYIYLGCKTLTMDQANEIKDFARLGHSELSNMMTGWIVSKRVRDFIIANKIRGLRFRPIMIRGSEFHRVYLKLWKELISFLSLYNVEYQQMPVDSLFEGN